MRVRGIEPSVEEHGVNDACLLSRIRQFCCALNSIVIDVEVQLGDKYCQFSVKGLSLLQATQYVQWRRRREDKAGQS